MKKFIVAGTQRSGTTLITTSLDSHPSIHCAGELFKMHQPRGDVEVLDGGYQAYVDSALRLRLADFCCRRFLVPAFLDRFFEQSGFNAIGFKLMDNQTYPGRFPVVIRYLIGRQVSVIHVIRENVFKTHLSRLIAQRRQVFHATQELTDLPKLKISTCDLLPKLSRIESQNTRLKSMFEGSVPYLAVTYESYTANPEREKNACCRFSTYQLCHFSLLSSSSPRRTSRRSSRTWMTLDVLCVARLIHSGYVEAIFVQQCQLTP